MPLDVLDVIKSYKLDKTKSLFNRLEQFTIDEWLDLSETLDECYSTLPLPHTYLNSTPLTFSFPCLPPDALPDISTHLLISENVFLDDPLYDLAAFLANFEVDSKETFLLDIGRKAFIYNATSTIEFYLRAKELIKEKKLVIYKRTSLPAFVTEFVRIYNKSIWKDTRLQRILYGNHLSSLLVGLLVSLNLPGFIYRYGGNSAVKYMLKLPRLQQSLESSLTKIPIFSSLSVFALCGGLEGLSTDFIRPDYAYLFRRSLDFASQANIELAQNNRLLLPAGFSANGIQVPLLRNVPVERVLDTIWEESSAFESFRLGLSEKLLQISTPVGSIEREKEILSIRESIQRDVSEITLAMNGIQKSFHKKITANVLLATFSILVAGFSTLGQNLDALSIGGSVFSGATLSISFKEFVKEWLDYQQKSHELKSKNNYFVWKILSNK